VNNPNTVHPQPSSDKILAPVTADIRVSKVEPILSPHELRDELPPGKAVLAQVARDREAISAVLEGRDDRLLAIVGPCSIHDQQAAFDYAERLKRLSDELSDRLLVVMRVYFEKPRTRLGWKGLILDPRLDGSNDIQEGLRVARRILLGVAERGLPSAVEALDPIVPQYLDDLVSWAAIGARTTESQTHREMASGLSVPVGFKNGTDGSLDAAVNAMVSSNSPHSFIGMDHDGRTAIIHTTGNELGHIILRGGKNGPNYYRDRVEEAASLLRSAGLPQRIIIDCSHENSAKKPERQSLVLEETTRYRESGLDCIKGFMLESFLENGRQDIPKDLSTLRYGLSVTDGCLGWAQTEALLRRLFGKIKP